MEQVKTILLNAASFLSAVSLDNWVDIVGILGFGLSLYLAIHQFLVNRMKISAKPFVLIEAYNKVPNSIFLLATLYNKTRNPFSLISLHVRDRKSKIDIPVEPVVRTFAARATDDKAAVRPVVLSPRFPVRFEPYEAHVLLLELDRQNIDMRLLHPGDPAHNPEGRSRIRRLLCTPYIHRLPLRLVLSTSRGRRAIPIYVSSAETWDYLESYAVRKAAYEEKVEFPQ